MLAANDGERMNDNFQPALLNDMSPVPLYAQLKQDILARINNGDLPNGCKLPSEIEMSIEYAVSRNTVRTALLELAEEGYLIRKQGKGTFVRHQKVAENISSNISFTEVCIANGIEPGHHLVTLSLQQASEQDIAALGIKQDERVLFIERILLGNNIPVVLDQAYFPEKYAALMKENLEDVSLYATIARLFNITMQRSRKTIELAYASDREAEFLNIKKDSPVLLMTETVYDAEGSPVHRSKQIVLGDRFKYVVY